MRKRNIKENNTSSYKKVENLSCSIQKYILHISKTDLDDLVIEIIRFNFMYDKGMKETLITFNFSHIYSKMKLKVRRKLYGMTQNI